MARTTTASQPHATLAMRKRSPHRSHEYETEQEHQGQTESARARAHSAAQQAPTPLCTQSAAALSRAIGRPRRCFPRARSVIRLAPVAHTEPRHCLSRRHPPLSAPPCRRTLICRTWPSTCRSALLGRAARIAAVLGGRSTSQLARAAPPRAHAPRPAFEFVLGFFFFDFFSF